MSPHLTPHITFLRTLLDGADKHDALEALWEYARANGMRKSSMGVSAKSNGAVYLGTDVVVKANFNITSIDNVPREYRPEQHTVWENPTGERGGIGNTIVVQPRYSIPTHGPLGLLDYDSINDRTPSWVRESMTLDAHAGNWGFREDGSPVLFDW